MEEERENQEEREGKGEGGRRPELTVDAARCPEKPEMLGPL